MKGQNIICEDNNQTKNLELKLTYNLTKISTRKNSLEYGFSNLKNFDPRNFRGHPSKEQSHAARR
jgi:hypothetical protein